MKQLYIFLCVLLGVSSVNSVYAYNWAARSGAGLREWTAVASSADGMKLVAGDLGHILVTSADGGVTWTEQTDPTSIGHKFIKIVSSSDGTLLAAVDTSVAHPYVYTSQDGGITWIEHTSMSSPTWSGIASSTDGGNLVVTNAAGFLYTSVDTGNTWTLQSTGSHGWWGVSSSSDGMMLAAITNSLYVGGAGDYIYTSADGGVTWVPQTGSGIRDWLSIATSADGLTIIATASDASVVVSSDGGVTWTTAGVASGAWSAVSSSADGMKLAFTVNGGLLYTSTDGGTSWMPETSAGVHDWGQIASSADGTKYAVLGGIAFDYIYTTVISNAPYFTAGAAQFVSVCQNSGANAIDLLLEINDPDIGQTEIWSVCAGAAQGTVVASDTVTSIGGVHTPVGLSYTPLTGYSGSDSFQVSIYDGFESDTITIYVEVSPLPAAAVVTGTYEVCVAGSALLTADIAGGTWSVSNANAGIAAGIVTGLIDGVDTISYTVSNSCGSEITTHVVTVNALPVAITGVSDVCEGSTTTLSDLSSGGGWSSSDAGIASIDAGTGVVTGVTPGAAVISYSLPTGCLQTVTFTVNALPAPVGGALSVCAGLVVSVTNATPGGTWSSSDLAVATIGSLTGTLAGLTEGIITVSYSLGTGCVTTATTTVNGSPDAISGTLTVCAGSTTVLSNGVPGGTWSSSNTATGTIDLTTGDLAGIANGNTIISYILPDGCYKIAEATINATPAAIAGTLTLCEGAATTLTDATSSGIWISGSTSVASVTLAGIVTGVAAGTSTISYSLGTGCFASAIVTVDALPSPISGAATVCIGFTSALSSTPTGTWSSSNNTIAAIGSATGIVSGIAPGTVTITYSLATGCYHILAMTVNDLPSPIVGLNQVCVASSIIIASATAGGSWSSSDITLAVISATGAVTGVAAGVPVMTYTMPTGCFTTFSVTVNALPSPITGSLEICAGTSSTLSSATPFGGTWESSSSAVATIGSLTGLLAGLSAGITSVSYTNIFGCRATAVVTIDPLPAPITGTFNVCPASVTMLSSVPAGGTWISSIPSVATVGLLTGAVTGVTPGTVIISYTFGTGCLAVAIITVNTLPAPITGPAAVCTGGTATMATTTPGGTWASAPVTVATISTSGLLTGITAGTVSVSYFNSYGCFTNTIVTVEPTPIAGVITGSSNICIGGGSPFSNTVSGGTWTSSNTSVATVSLAGLVTGVAPGTAAISYTATNVCGAASTSIMVTVHTLANAGIVSGADSVCEGISVALTDPVTGGSWVSGNTSKAIVNSSGIVTGVATGTLTIMYIVTNACSADTADHVVFVRPASDCGISVGAIGNEVAISIYPNPTSGSFAIATPVAGTATIYTIDGREIVKITVRKGINFLSLPSGLAAGVYMCRFSGHDGSAKVTRLVYESN